MLNRTAVTMAAKRKDAEQFLKDLLKDGGIKLGKLKADADGAGWSMGNYSTCSKVFRY
jgi:hypothetical protein